MEIKSRELQELCFKEIDITDIEEIRLWKNSHSNYFFNSSEISVKEQREWFNKIYLVDKNNFIFIIYYKNEKIGCIGFRILENAWDIYNVMNINSNFKGVGIMHTSLKELIEFIKMKKNIDFKAKVLNSNQNLSWYLKNNFKVIDKNNNYTNIKYFG
jgi:hypothetical protein